MSLAVLKEVGIQNIDCIGAVATAAIPFASGLSDRLNLPLVIVKSKADDHGIGGRIEGSLEQGKRVLLLEDVVNEGSSLISAAKALRDAGAVVITCMSLFTYGLSETLRRLEENNLSLLALSDLETLLTTGVEIGQITPEQRNVVREWAMNPGGWNSS
jgi:orotate phosphoribosyltransferase